MPMPINLTHGGLFEGIGGFSIGAQRCGIKTKWVCEINQYRKQILRQHFPDAEQYRDIRNITPPKLILSQEVFHARIYQLLEKVWASLESKADSGQSISELFMKAIPGTSLLKILLSYEIKDLKLSYMTFPKSGMMRNGNVYELPNLVTLIDEKDYSLLPTPLKSDGDKSGMFKSSAALMKYLESHTDRLVYQCQLNGFSRKEILATYQAIMGFPQGWTEIKSRQLEMQLYQT